MKTKVNIQYKNGNQGCYEVICAYPCGNDVFISEVCHYADGTKAIFHHKIPDSKIIHVEVVGMDLSGFTFKDDEEK